MFKTTANLARESYSSSDAFHNIIPNLSNFAAWAAQKHSWGMAYVLAKFSLLFECLVEEEREMLQELDSANTDSENHPGRSSETIYFIGLDVHKKNNQFLHEGRGWLGVEEG